VSIRLSIISGGAASAELVCDGVHVAVLKGGQHLELGRDLRRVHLGVVGDRLPIPGAADDAAGDLPGLGYEGPVLKSGPRGTSGLHRLESVRQPRQNDGGARRSDR
jgi:hypothetical protein